MCTFEYKIGKTGIKKNKFAQVDKNFTCFYIILSQLLCAKFSVRKFVCAKKITFRRCELYRADSVSLVECFSTLCRLYLIPSYSENLPLWVLFLAPLFVFLTFVTKDPQLPVKNLENYHMMFDSSNKLITKQHVKKQHKIALYSLHQQDASFALSNILL